jgi:hypothetical protein
VRADALFFDNQNALVSVLREHGFENLYLSSRADSALMIYYENRLYRNELYASGIVAALAFDVVADFEKIVLVPCKRAFPVCELELDVRLYESLIRSDMEQAEQSTFSGLLTVKNVSHALPFLPMDLERPAIGKIDVTLYPTFSVHLGNYDDRFKMFFAVMPVVSTTLWKGAAVYAEASVPLYNDVNYHYMRFKDYPQLSKAAFSQIVRLPFDVVTNFSFGAFNPNRWGLAGEVNKLLLNRRLAIGYSFEYTGFLLYYDNVWNYSKLNLTTDKMYAWYYSDMLNSQIGLSFNRYVMKDSGPLFEFIRNFKDTSVGFFFGGTEIDKFGGIMIRFPFSPKKRPTPSTFRVTLPRYYEYSYRATNYVYTQHAPIQTGISVYTGTKLTYLYQNLTPNYVKRNAFLYKEAFDYIKMISERREEDENLFQFLKR